MLKLFNKFRKNSRGDTITEVLIAIAIAAFVIGITYETAQRSLNQSSTAKEHSEALNILENQVTDLKLRFQNTPANLFQAEFSSTVNHFCLDDNTTSPTANWLPYQNYQIAIDANSPLKDSAVPGPTTPYNTACKRTKSNDGAVYYIDIQTTSGGPTATVYQVFVRWERVGGGQPNQVSTYYRIDQTSGSSFGLIEGQLKYKRYEI